MMTTEQRDGGIPAPDDAEPARGKMLELGLGAVEARRDPLGILQLQETERTDVVGIPHGAEPGDRDGEASGRRSFDRKLISSVLAGADVRSTSCSTPGDQALCPVSP